MHNNGWYHWQSTNNGFGAQNTRVALIIARNCNSLRHVCLHCNVNVYECLKTPSFKLQNKNESLKHAVFSTQNFSFKALSMVERNTGDDSRNHPATSNVDGKVFLKRILFARWSYILNFRTRHSQANKNVSLQLLNIKISSCPLSLQ
jgi:hypothetical protein